MNSKESVADVIEEEDEDEVLESESNVNSSDVNAPSGGIQRVIRRVDSSSNHGLTNSEGSEDEDNIKSSPRQSQLSG